MSVASYLMSFTAGSLFHSESVRIAALFLELRDWHAVRGQIISENVLQARTMSASERMCREICSRLKTLDTREMELLVHGTVQDQSQLLWVAVCRRYRFIADFAVEVLREKFLGLNFDLYYEEFDHFFERKADMHPELDAIKPGTRNKLRQVLFRMLREAHLLAADHALQPVGLSADLREALARNHPRDLLLFPTLDSVPDGSQA